MAQDFAKQSDEALAKRVQAGEQEVFGELVKRYEAKMLRYAAHFLIKHPDTEDAVQEVFLKAYRNLRAFDASRTFAPWLYRVAHNEFVNRGKRRARDFLDFVDFDAFFPHPFAKERSDTIFQDDEFRSMMRQCLDDLPVKYREVLVLSYLEGLDYRAISEVLRIPVSTVGVRILRGKSALKTVCERRGAHELL